MLVARSVQASVIGSARSATASAAQYSRHVRVVGGTLRGRRLVTPLGTVVRPTSDRAREAIFNVLFGLVDLDGTAVVDLFAGSGALGIEAVSRGAANAVLVENDRAARKAIETNVAALGVADRVRLVAADAVTWVRPTVAADVVFVDPPYRFDGWADLLAAITAEVTVAESDHEVAPPAHLAVLKVKRYGGTVVTFMGPVGDAVADGETRGDGS